MKQLKRKRIQSLFIQKQYLINKIICSKQFLYQKKTREVYQNYLFILQKDIFIVSYFCVQQRKEGLGTILLICFKIIFSIAMNPRRVSRHANECPRRQNPFIESEITPFMPSLLQKKLQNLSTISCQDIEEIKEIYPQETLDECLAKMRAALKCEQKKSKIAVRCEGDTRDTERFIPVFQMQQELEAFNDLQEPSELLGNKNWEGNKSERHFDTMLKDFLSSIRDRN